MDLGEDYHSLMKFVKTSQSSNSDKVDDPHYYFRSNLIQEKISQVVSNTNGKRPSCEYSTVQPFSISLR